MIFIVFITFALIYLVFLSYSRSFRLNLSYQRQSLLSFTSKHMNSAGFYKSLMVKLGTMIVAYLPQQSVEKLESEYFNLDRSQDDMRQTIAEAVSVCVLLMLVYLFDHNFVFLLLSFLLPALLILEINIALYQFKKDIEASVEHLVRCLKVLVIKSETPIINALELIMRDLPAEYEASKRELSKLVNKSAKSGLRNTLLEWKTDLPKFRDFIALLISINDGASKHALKLSFDNFLKKIESIKSDEIRDQAENAQLYLMAPVVVMLIVVSLPMVDAVRFLMMEAMK